MGPKQRKIFFQRSQERSKETSVERCQEIKASKRDSMNEEGQIRGAHIMFCNLDELMKSLLCYLHYITDQFCNTCDIIFYLVLYNNFHSIRQNVR